MSLTLREYYEKYAYKRVVCKTPSNSKWLSGKIINFVGQDVVEIKPDWNLHETVSVWEDIVNIQVVNK